MGLFKRTDSNAGSATFGPRVAEANVAPLSQTASPIVPVARDDLRELEAHQRRLAVYIAEAIGAREATSLTADVYRVSRQVDSQHFFMNLRAELAHVDEAVSQTKNIVRVLLSDGVDPPPVGIEKLEKDLESITYLIDEREGKDAPLEQREESGDHARRTMRDVDKFFKWVASSCREMSAKVLDDIKGLVTKLLEAQGPERNAVPDGNERVARDISASGRLGGSRQSDRGVIATPRSDRS